MRNINFKQFLMLFLIFFFLFGDLFSFKKKVNSFVKALYSYISKKKQEKRDLNP